MRLFLRLILCAAACILAGCNSPVQTPSAVDRQQITQVSILNALMVGNYDGVMPIRELLRYGDFGVGTCDHLDGELIVLEGKAFQAKSDGTVVEVPPQETTPFAIVTALDKTGEIRCADVGSLEELESHLDAALANLNLFYAIRIDAEFDSITFRSVGRQDPPYAPLAEVAKKQSVWTHEKMKGTLVGIRSPKWVGGLGVPGYHWHVLSDDHKLGGHVLDCKFPGGAAIYDRCGSWLIKLDESTSWTGSDVGADLSKEVEQVERLRGNKN
jgi:acetolactate decarboxylase